MTVTRAPSSRTSRLLLELHPRPPFRLDLTAWALRRREQNAIDTWDGRRYSRALLIAGRPVAVAVRQAGGADARGSRWRSAADGWRPPRLRS